MNRLIRSRPFLGAQAFVFASPLPNAHKLASSQSAFCGLRTSPHNSLQYRSLVSKRSSLRFHPERKSVSMKIASDGDSVIVHYTGYLDDGTEFDSSLRRGDPLNFVIGAGTVIRGFDDAVRGLQVGESRKTRIEPENAYGNRSEDLVVNMPRSRVPESMDISKGMRLPLSNGMMATVLEVTSDSIKLDANHELAGKALTFDMELVGFKETVLGSPAEGLERAVFGLGCFWGAELAYQRKPGVVATKVGYSHGQKENPTYQEVCSGNTGHAEVVAVDFNPKEVSFKELVDLFWERLGRSALTLNQVGNDVGTQYRSGIYYQSEEQKALAESSKEEASQRFGQPVVVEVVNGESVPFYIAETYHQRYLEKRGQSAEKNATETIRCYG